MSIQFRVLGGAGRDNALFVQVDSGQAIERLLFDCGEGCAGQLEFSDVHSLDHLFFSHLHMDHVAGFDSFFRCNFNRDTEQNRIWGPPQTRKIMQCRFRGFIWNLHEKMSASWRVSDIMPREVHTSRFELREAFEIEHGEGARPYDRVICSGIGFTVEAITLDHRTPSIGYVVKEKSRHNVDVSRMAAMGLKPGPWVKELKSAANDAKLEVEGKLYTVGELREALVVESEGDSVAYLTDFLLAEPELERLSEWLAGCKTVVCEAQYAHADLELAKRNHHMTARLSATLAQKAEAQELVLMHLSDRYQRSGWMEMLQEARAVFPNARFPEHWRM